MPDSSDPLPVPDATLPVSRPEGSLPRQDAPDLPLPEELTALLPGGNYRVESFLGQGGMGAVYKGMQIRLKRPVAIKIMRRDQGKDYGFEQRFEREAQAMAKLNHPNIVSVIDYGEAGPDYLYIVMELIDGADMMDVIRGGQMTQEMALALLPQVCDALQFAHDHGIVHRDIKPSNIMLTRDGRVKMCDFGLAKPMDAMENSFRTQTGTGMGTPDYAAPEQFDAHAHIDHRADIYALGVMIYQMITGQLPRGVWKPPSQRAEVDPKWDEIVGHAMQTDPAERYQKASEIKTDVGLIGPSRRASEAAPKVPKNSGVATPAAASRKARPVAVVILGLVALVSFYLSSVFWSRSHRSAVDTAPTADAAAVPETSVAEGGIDLLALADVAKDAEGGIWKREGTDLVGADDPTARRSLGSRLGLALPVRVEGSYRLEVEFTKRGRKEPVSVILPLSGGRSVMSNFQDSGDLAGLVEVRGMHRKDEGNPTLVPNVLTDGLRYRAAVEVRLKGDQADITATLEGKPLFRYQGAVADLDSGRFSMADPARPGIKSMDPVTWHRVRLASLDGGTATPARDDVILPGSSGAAPAPKEVVADKTVDQHSPPRGNKETVVEDESIDLLALSDVVKDAEGGLWSMAGTDLIVAKDPAGEKTTGIKFGFSLPVVVKGSYQIEVEFTKHGPSGTVSLDLPLFEDRSVLAHFQEFTPYAGLMPVRGFNTRDPKNPTRTPHQMENGRRYRAKVQVLLNGDQADIAATFEGAPLFRFQGPVADLGNQKPAPHDEARPRLRSIDPVTWHSVRITPLEGGILTPVRSGVILPGASGPATLPKAVVADKTVDLLAGVEVKRDALMEPWTLENGALRSPQGINRKAEGLGIHQMLVFPTPHPPVNYDLRYRLTRNTKGFAVAFVFEQNGSTVDLRMDGGHGIGFMPTPKNRENKEKQWLPPGETHEVLIEVREDRVCVSVDGVLEFEQEGTQPDDLRRNDPFYPPEKVKRPFLGIGVCGGDITVHSAELREVDKNSGREASTTSAK